jgi:hypothetical protein
MRQNHDSKAYNLIIFLRLVMLAVKKWNFLMGTVGFRRHPCQLPKFSPKMAVAVEPAIQGDHHS